MEGRIELMTAWLREAWRRSWPYVAIAAGALLIWWLRH
jgi:hypothetical protein